MIECRRPERLTFSWLKDGWGDEEECVMESAASTDGRKSHSQCDLLQHLNIKCN